MYTTEKEHYFRRSRNSDYSDEYSSGLWKWHCLSKTIPLGNIIQRSENLLILNILSLGMEDEKQKIESVITYKSINNPLKIATRFCSPRLENIIRDSVAGVIALSGIGYSSFQFLKYGISTDSIFAGVGGAILLGEIAIGRIID